MMMMIYIMMQSSSHFQAERRSREVSGPPVELGTCVLASTRFCNFLVLVLVSLQTTHVLWVYPMYTIYGWSEVKTVLQIITSTRECTSSQHYSQNVPNKHIIWWTCAIAPSSKNCKKYLSNNPCFALQHQAGKPWWVFDFLSLFFLLMTMTMKLMTMLAMLSPVEDVLGSFFGGVCRLHRSSTKHVVDCLQSS